MNYLADIRRDREDLARVLDKHTGIRAIVEDLYPDRAHFIYELLQNAEDAQATEASFVLHHDHLIFEHDGRSFNEADVRAITDIGAGTKGDAEDKIGRFGVGFKAVFLYTETPRIWSPEVSFEISKLVLPTALPPESALGSTTRFEFPFNNPKKSAAEAYEEIAAGLTALATTSLLFLNHLRCLSWRMEGQSRYEFRRQEYNQNHVVIEKRDDGAVASELHFLRFMQPAVGLDKQQVALAYELEPLANKVQSGEGQSFAERFRIASASPGMVAVFFPAEKEASGLRFHLHAPFVPELSRASIKDTPANEPLLDQLAELTAESLYTVRDLELLTREFLGVLPNPQDQLPERYQRIQSRVVDEMNRGALTPTHTGGHAPAEQLMQAKASLKDLLMDADLEHILGEREAPLTWAIGAQQRNSSQDRFLRSLAIRLWDVDAFTAELSKRLDSYRFGGPDPTMLSWLSGKSDDWLQQLYALLYRELEPEDGFYELEDCSLVRTTSNTYQIGSECFFPGEEHDSTDGLVHVAPGTYTSGKNEREMTAARQFLEAIGVRGIGEAERIEGILKQRYSYDAEIPDEQIYQQDLMRFIEFTTKCPDVAKSLFRDYYVFMTAADDWRKPEAVYLDRPFRDTDLSAYYGAFDSSIVALANDYGKMGILPKDIGNFALVVGAHASIAIVETEIWDNPDVDYLLRVAGERHTSPINCDYFIPRLGQLLQHPNIELSRLIWRTMCAIPNNSKYLVATYQKNYSHGPRHAPSQLVHRLRDVSWVPQGEGTFVRPRDASPELLPPGFPFDQSDSWLKHVEFGEASREQAVSRQQRRAVAQQLGFEDEEVLAAAQWFANLPSHERQRFRTEYEHLHVDDLPEQESRNPEHRARQVFKGAQAAPERESQMRSRSVAVDYEAVKQEAEQYLRQQYTTDGVMICQACRRALPFKLDDGSYYFEKIELIPKLAKRHYQNYIALCPNHAAMFQYANDSRDKLPGLVQDGLLGGISLSLAKVETSLHFTEVHLSDLRVILESEALESVQQAARTEESG